MYYAIWMPVCQRHINSVKCNLPTQHQVPLLRVEPEGIAEALPQVLLLAPGLKGAVSKELPPRVAADVC